MISMKHAVTGCAVIAAVTAAPAPAQPASKPTPVAEAAEDEFRRALLPMFRHGRATAFRMMARERMCRGSDFRDEFLALSERIDAVALQLAARYPSRSAFFRRADEPTPESQQCDEYRLSITMAGYRNAVGELEAVVK